MQDLLCEIRKFPKQRPVFSSEDGARLMALCKRVRPDQVTDELRQTILQFGSPDMRRYFLRKAGAPTWIPEIYANERMRDQSTRGKMNLKSYV